MISFHRQQFTCIFPPKKVHKLKNSYETRLHLGKTCLYIIMAACSLETVNHSNCSTPCSVFMQMTVSSGEVVAVMGMERLCLDCAGGATWRHGDEIESPCVHSGVKKEEGRQGVRKGADTAKGKWAEKTPGGRRRAERRDNVWERETEEVTGERERERDSVLHLSADSCLPCEARPAPGRSSCFSHTPHRQ